MGTSSSRDHEVHVVVVQSQEGGQMDAKMIRGAYSEAMKKKGTASELKQTSDSGDRATRRTPPSHLDIAKEPDSNDPYYSNGYIGTTSIYDNGKHRTEFITGAGYERGRPESIDTRRPSEGSTKRQRRQGVTGKVSSKDLQSKSYHRQYNSHITGGTYSTSTLETQSINDRDTPHTQVELSPVSESSVVAANAGNMFELFRTFEGEEFTVYVREDGKKFYVDFEEQKWRYFPDAWGDRGNFLPIDHDPYQVQSDDGTTGRQKQFTGVREGEFIHPTRGKLVTYLRKETTNVLYFFDEGTGSWYPMPLSWERHVPGVTSIISEVQKACPEWKDAKSIVAMLRCCKYSVEESVSVYNAINDDGVLDYSEAGLYGGRDPFKNLNEKKLKETAAQLRAMNDKHKEAKKQLEQLQSKVDELETENKRMKRELENGKMEHRKQSKMHRQQSLSQSFRGGIQPSVIRPLLTILGEESRTLKAKFTALRSVATKGLTSYAGSLHQLSKSVEQLVRIHWRQKREIVEVRTLYQKEALQRKLLFNEVQELKGNIRVFCRCRYDKSDRCHLRFDDDRVTCTTQQGRKKLFEFERVYMPDTTQEKVFEDTKPIITSCVDGYNVCILAYGQTGAGKTYTMMGEREAYGVNIRFGGDLFNRGLQYTSFRLTEWSMKELFKICNERTKVKYTMRVSMVEVYNEAVYDLLASPDEGHQKLQLQNKGKNVAVPGLIEIEVRTMEDVMMIFNEGEKNRTVASTKMNTSSSRSHLLFFLKVEGFDVVSRATTRGRLTLVDLAGSERISRSEASGIRLVEAAAINKSLSALGQVFASIRTGALHIPYRNSKLTHLLQPSIGGDSKACMFVNVSPLQCNVLETISTLEFGQNVRQVELGKATKHVTRAPN